MATERGDALAEPFALIKPVQGALRLVASSRAALALGLTPGVTLADARARTPHLAVADHDPAGDAALLALMAEACDRWTPSVALDAPHGLILDVTGCSHLFGGEAALRAQIVARFRRGGFAVRASVAGAPDAARALARFSQVTVVPPGEEAAAIRPLPIAALGIDGDACRALALAGLKKISDLADRPSRPLAARFGEDLITRLRRTLGMEDRRIDALRLRPAIVVERRFAEPIAHAEAIEDALRTLMGEAARLLEAQGLGGRRFEAAFFRADGAVRRVSVGTGRPSRDPPSVLRLFATRLDTLADPLDPGFGFDLVRLAAPVVEPLAEVEPRFDGDERAQDEVCDLVDRLVARYGPARVLGFQSADTNDPARASRLVPAAASDMAPALWSSSENGEPPLRPLHLFDRPQPIHTIAETPDGPPLRFRWRRVLHRIARAEGPERIASEWWREPAAPTRDYYRVEDAEGRRFWVFREGLYGRETAEPRWYLHGLFA